MTSSWKRALWSSTLALSLVSPVFLPEANAEGKPEKDKGKVAEKEKAPENDPTVITNETLLRLFGPPEATPVADSAAAKSDDKDAKAAKEGAGEGSKPAAPKPAPYDPLKAMQEEQKKAAERQAKIADAEKRVLEAQANVQSLEKRLLEQKNPYLPRPQLTEKEAEAERGLDGAARVERTQQQIDEARKAVDQAKADLEKTRSGTPSGN